MRSSNSVSTNANSDIKARRPDLNILAGEKIPFEKYMQVLCNSKLIVSPWGYGEWLKKYFIRTEIVVDLCSFFIKFCLNCQGQEKMKRHRGAGPV